MAMRAKHFARLCAVSRGSSLVVYSFWRWRCGEALTHAVGARASTPPPMASQQGEWTTETAGGCPKHPSWATNPQFQIFPTVEGASYTLQLQQHVPAPHHAIGFWLMQADNSTDRKVTLSKSHMVTKTKYKAAAKVSHTVELPKRPGGLPYIVVVSTFDPQLLGRFTLTLASTDEAATLIP